MVGCLWRSGRVFTEPVEAEEGNAEPDGELVLAAGDGDPEPGRELARAAEAGDAEPDVEPVLAAEEADAEPVGELALEVEDGGASFFQSATESVRMYSVGAVRFAAMQSRVAAWQVERMASRSWLLR